MFLCSISNRKGTAMRWRRKLHTTLQGKTWRRFTPRLKLSHLLHQCLLVGGNLVLHGTSLLLYMGKDFLGKNPLWKIFSPGIISIFSACYFLYYCEVSLGFLFGICRWVTLTIKYFMTTNRPWLPVDAEQLGKVRDSPFSLWWFSILPWEKLNDCSFSFWWFVHIYITFHGVPHILVFHPLFFLVCPSVFLYFYLALLFNAFILLIL